MNGHVTTYAVARPVLIHYETPISFIVISRGFLTASTSVSILNCSKNSCSLFGLLAISLCLRLPYMGGYLMSVIRVAAHLVEAKLGLAIATH